MKRVRVKLGKKKFDTLLCENVFEQMKGLMFESKEKRSSMLFLFKKSVRLGVHTFFMRFPLKIYFFDEDYRIVEEVELKPWQYYRPRRKTIGFFEVYKEIAPRGKVTKIKIENL